jgi:hypothetical protein
MSHDDIEIGIRVRSFSDLEPPLVRRHSFSSLKPDFTGVFDKLVDIVDKSGYNTPRLALPRMETLRFEFQNPLERVPSFLLETEEHDKKDCSRVINRFIFNAFENEDGKVTYLQAAFIVLHSLFEVYRAVISSFLTVFVPQRCPDGNICSLYNNVVPRDQLERIAIGFNAFMAAYFCMLFLVEATRERRIQEYLAISKEAPRSKKHLIELMCNMDKDERTELLHINNSYRLTGIYMMVFFFVNSGLSWAVVYKNYLDNSTFITFTTNALFMINKLYGVLKITSSGEYNIYSAYLNDNLVYNKGNLGSLLNPPYEALRSNHSESTAPSKSTSQAGGFIYGGFLSLRNPPFTKTIGNNSGGNSREDSSKSFVEDLESRLSIFQSKESNSGKE